MREGMLWFDNDPQRDLAQKVGRAADYYQRKHGRPANRCYVHPGTIEEPMTVDGVEVAGLPSVLRHHFWVGVEQASVA